MITKYSYIYLIHISLHLLHLTSKYDEGKEIDFPDKHFPKFHLWYIILVCWASGSTNLRLLVDQHPVKKKKKKVNWVERLFNLHKINAITWILIQKDKSKIQGDAHIAWTIDFKLAERLSALHTSCPFLVLISVRGWVDPRATVQLEGLGNWTIQWSHWESNLWPSGL
jgi:hypothetical protein